MSEDGGCPREIEPAAFARLREREAGLVVLDVREAWEIEIARLPATLDIAMAALPERVDELDPGRPVVVVCHHGGRSLSVADWLRGRGFTRAQSLAGGIERWAEEMDPSVPRY